MDISPSVNGDNENRGEYENLYIDVISNNERSTVPSDFNVGSLIESIEGKEVISESQLNILLSLLDILEVKNDKAILDKLFQLDYAIDSGESTEIHFTILFDNIYRILATDLEKNKDSLDKLQILRKEIV
ncbi:MAG: hypothetical protein LBQ59_04730 [Candidatus Peribacteria bacterium]|nr:hypothetical protein [Candidatus Peribacteria bacterium]